MLLEPRRCSARLNFNQPSLVVTFNNITMASPAFVGNLENIDGVRSLPLHGKSIDDFAARLE